jgi:subtilisin-like proprotein convertase family protein
VRGRLAFASAALLAACGAEPRHGEALLHADATGLALSGTTFGAAAAMELAPGCPGYLDPSTPSHVLHLAGDGPVAVTARSDEGPLALALVNGEEVDCDSDEGAGHRPRVEVTGPGDFLVYVAALRRPEALAYRVEVARPGRESPVAADPNGEVQVTVTSIPPGAEVRTGDGAVHGVTPAMFVLPPGTAGAVPFELRLDGHRPVRLEGTPAGGALTLHAQLLPLGPRYHRLADRVPRPIRDLRAAVQQVEVPTACAVTDLAVRVELRHDELRDLRVTLRPPHGEPITLLEHAEGGARALARTFTASNGPLSTLVGQEGSGLWRLAVRDDAAADEGELRAFELQVVCAADSPDEEGAEAPRLALGPERSTPLGAPRPRPPRPPRRPPPPPPPRLSDVPPRIEVVRIMSRLRPQVEACGTGQARAVQASIDVHPSGRVRGVSVSNAPGNAARSCITRVLRTARFPRFSNPRYTFTHTYSLPGSR